MLTDHKLMSLTMTLGTSTKPSAITVTTTDDGTFTVAATGVESTVDVDSNKMPSTDLQELKILTDSLVSIHQSIAGI